MHNPITAKVLIQDLFDACKNAGYLPSVAVSAFHFRSFRKTVRLLYLTRVPVSTLKWGRFNQLSVFSIDDDLPALMSSAFDESTHMTGNIPESAHETSVP